MTSHRQLGAYTNGFYVKHRSFECFVSRQPADVCQQQMRRCVRLLAHDQATSALEREIFQAVVAGLQNNLAGVEGGYGFNRMIAEELQRIDDEMVQRYLFHRYRYDVNPKGHRLDAYPPYVQIEPVSYCNYKCVFCYQTNPYFKNKRSPHMGTMSLTTFKRIIDELEGNVDFLSIASRGEPTLSKDLAAMLAYVPGKFLALKLNTNAYALQDDQIHAILAGGVQTLVISADAADPETYRNFRVHGDLKRVIANLERFAAIRQRDYPESRLIVRVSGVMLDERQTIDTMAKTWLPLVDQVAFVKYNPWENVYGADVTHIDTPCSDLWRRLFVWHDGTVNPCDTDFQSTLSPGNVLASSIAQIWQGTGYQALRHAHLHGRRSHTSPCNRCTVI